MRASRREGGEKRGGKETGNGQAGEQLVKSGVKGISIAPLHPEHSVPEVFWFSAYLYCLFWFICQWQGSSLTQLVVGILGPQILEEYSV